MDNNNNLLWYALRWQLSTPILWIVMQYFPGPVWVKTVIANIIGALIFFRIDKVIFNGMP
jgi:hypothetical protein